MKVFGVLFWVFDVVGCFMCMNLEVFDGVVVVFVLELLQFVYGIVIIMLFYVDDCMYVENVCYGLGLNLMGVLVMVFVLGDCWFGV